MLFSHRDIQCCSYSCLLSWDAVEAVVTLNAAIMLAHRSNSCSEEKLSTKLYETQLFCNWVEVFLLTPHCDFSGKVSSRVAESYFSFPVPQTDGEPLVKLPHANIPGPFVVWLHDLCVCFLPSPSSCCLLVSWLIFICLTADIETEICLLAAEKPPQISCERSTSFTNLKKSHFLSWKCSFLIKEVIEEVLEILLSGAENVNAQKRCSNDLSKRVTFW